MSKVTIEMQEEKIKEYSLPLYLEKEKYLYQIIEMNDYYYLLCVNNGLVMFGYKTRTIKEILDSLKDYKIVDVHIKTKTSA